VKGRRERYKEEYEAAKSRGRSFFPYTVFTDAVTSLVVVVAIVLLAVLVGAKTESIADPTSTTYNPRPEWYFLFLFELLKFFPGRLEPFAITVLPIVAVVVLFALPFFDRNERRHPLRRPVGVSVGAVLLIGIVTLTALGYASPLVNAPSTESPEVAQGRRVFRELGCLYCHSIGGEGGAVGPDLTDVASRLDEGAISAYLANPNAMIPQSLHPKLQFTNEEIQALTAYLGTLGASVEYSAEAPKLFDENCGVCHSLDGSGGKIGPDLSRVGTFRDVGYLETFIGDPESVVPESGMPAFEAKLSAAGIHGIAACLSNLKGETTPSLDGTTTSTESSGAGEAEELFGSYCAGCHSSPPGEGLTAGEVEGIITSGRDDMPAFGDRLTSEQIAELGEYLATSP